MKKDVEIWRNIVGYENLYQASNWGRVKSLERVDSLGHLRKERILRAVKSSNGYLHVTLFKNGKRKTFNVHRLVALVFIPNPDNLPQVNHRDENKTNNTVDNLEWCDVSYNLSYNDGQKKRAKKKKGLNNTRHSKLVYQYSLDNKFIAEYPSTMEVERQTGFEHNCISKCCLGKYKQAYGFIWRYK